MTTDPTTDAVSPSNALPILWMSFGIFALTAILAAAFPVFTLAWAYAQQPTQGLAAVAFGFVTMWLPLSIINFIIACMAQILVYPTLFLFTLVLFRSRGSASLPMLIAISPLLGILVWYGYEHFVPEYRWYTDERPPYEYGLTVERFLIAWAFQLLIVVGFWWPMRGYRTRATA